MATSAPGHVTPPTMTHRENEVHPYGLLLGGPLLVGNTLVSTRCHIPLNAKFAIPRPLCHDCVTGDNSVRPFNTETDQMTFNEACKAIIANSNAPAVNYAVGYARAGLSMTDPEAIRVQCLYILNNITHWRGPIAKEARAAFKEAAK